MFLTCFHLITYALSCHSQVLIPLIRCSGSESLVFYSTFVHFSLRAFGEFPIGLICVKMEYLIDVECTSCKRYIRPVEGTPSIGRKVHYQLIVTFSNKPKFWNFDMMNISLNISLRLLHDDTWFINTFSTFICPKHLTLTIN